MPLRGNRLLRLHGLRRSRIGLRLRRHRLMVYRLMLRRLITLLRSGRRLLIALGRLLRLDFRRRRKQRFARAVIDQRFHRREFIICRRERVGARRLLGSVPLLLGGGELASQFILLHSIRFLIREQLIIIMRIALRLPRALFRLPLRR